MRLTDEHIRKFQAIYKARFGVDLTEDEAREKGTQLLRLMELVYKPMSNEEYELVQKRRLETLPLLTHKLQNHEHSITYNQRGTQQN